MQISSFFHQTDNLFTLLYSILGSMQNLSQRRGSQGSVVSNDGTPSRITRRPPHTPTSTRRSSAANTTPRRGSTLHQGRQFCFQFWLESIKVFFPYHCL